MDMPSRLGYARKSALIISLLWVIWPVAPLRAQTPTPGQIPPNQITALSFSEGFGTDVADSSHTGHNGVLVNGPTWTTGDFGNGISLDGTDDYVLMIDPSTLNFGTSDFTIAAWVRRRTTGTEHTILSKSANGAWVTGGKEFFISGSDNTLAFGCNGAGEVHSTGTIINDSFSHYVTVTFVDSSNTIKLYIDGVLSGSGTLNLPADGGNHVVKVGGHPAGHSFRGELDEFRVFSRALSATEIQTVMNTAIDPPTGPPVPCSYRVLVLYTDAANEPQTQLQTALLAEPGIMAADLFNAYASTPHLALLQQYNIVVVSSYDTFANATALGNNLADYVDAAGIVVQLPYSFNDPDQATGINGRWASGGYSPYLYPTGLANGTATLGTFNAAHPLMQGVSALQSNFHQVVPLAAGAIQVATWSNGDSLIATKSVATHMTIGVNAYIGSHATWSGDFPRVIANAGRWLEPAGCPTPTPGPPTPTPTPTPGPPTPTPTPTPAPSPTPFEGQTLLWEGFDTVVPPTLPSGWNTSFTSGPADCTPGGTCTLGTNWVTTTNNPFSGPICVFHDAPACVTDSVLDTRPFSVPNVPASIRVTFANSFNLESGRDGGVLEISVNGGRFIDITAAGGSTQYTGTISTQFQSPIAGRQAWTGNSGGYISRVATLPEYAKGQSVVLRFRLATDCSGGGTGWFIDTVWVLYNLMGTPPPTPTPSHTPTTPTPTPTPFPPPVCTFNEAFDSIGTLSSGGWVQRNNSNPVGLTGWFQGTSAVFPAQAGSSVSYIATNFNAAAGSTIISNWLLTPSITLKNGGLFTFWTRTVDFPTYPDRLQVRMSTNGNSSDVGTSATSVGDFNTLLLDINLTYTTSGYPNVWTQYDIVVSGIPSPVTGRLAFRYFVENGGSNGANSDYIGIDTVSYNCDAPTPTPTSTPALTPTPGTPTPTPTPTGAKIAFSSNPQTFESTYEVYVMDSNGSNQTRLTFRGPDMVDSSKPSWSPDGAKIAFQKQYFIPPSFPPNSYIYTMNADGSAQTPLTSSASLNSSPAWSPDGTKIVFVSSTSGVGGNAEIYVMDSNGANQTNLTNSPASGEDSPAWSPDSTKIVFTSSRDGNVEIYVMDANGSNQVRLTNNPALDTLPAWSPDGTKIAFTSQRDGNNEIYVMNANGSNQTNLTNNPGSDTDPSWSSDGAKIAFSSTRNGNGNIYAMDADGSNQTNLTNRTGIDRDPDWQRIPGTPTPTPTPPNTAGISGAVTYCSNPSSGPVPNVTMTLTGTSGGSTLTDGSGNYTFSSLTAGGTYAVTPAKSALTPGSAGINTVDVLAVQRHFLVIGAPLSGCRLAAADVSGDSAINTVDVLAIQRFFLGRTTGIANVGRYQFTPANRTYNSLVGSQTGENYDTLTFGDVASPFVGP